MICMLVLALCATLSPASAAFVRGAKTKDHDGRPILDAAWLSVESIERGLLDVLSASAFGLHPPGGRGDFDLAAIREGLRPLYRVLPKNKRGHIGHSTVRYALKRYFLGRDGLHMKGIDGSGELWNASLPSTVLEQFVPGLAQHLLEERSRDGLDLHQLSVLAATLEHMVHTEELHVLQEVYKFHGIDPEVGASERQTAEAFESYMLLLPVHINVSLVSTKVFHHLKSSSRSREVLAMARQAVAERRRTSPSGDGGEELIPFSEAAGVVKDLWARYGEWQGKECEAMRSTLLALEDKGSGRVKLADFYAGSSDGSWAFAESADYLRKLGALDDLNPHAPRVIIENYMGSAANCVVFSPKRSMCCASPCEALMRHVETEIGHPMAKPEKLIEVVSVMPSETVSAPRALSERLTHRLRTMAGLHGGRVTLHGRLFAQWMHHAFPRECPYPFKAGETDHVTPEEFREAGGEVKEQNLEQCIGDLKWLEKQPEARRTTSAEDLPWSHEEELVALHQRPSGWEELREVLRGVFMVLAFFAVAVHLHKMYGFLGEVIPAVVQIELKKKRSF